MTVKCLARLYSLSQKPCLLLLPSVLPVAVVAARRAYWSVALFAYCTDLARMPPDLEGGLGLRLSARSLSHIKTTSTSALSTITSALRLSKSDLHRSAPSLLRCTTRCPPPPSSRRDASRPALSDANALTASRSAYLSRARAPRGACAGCHFAEQDPRTLLASLLMLLMAVS